MFYDSSKYLTEKYFDIVWGCHPPRRPPKKPNFWTAQLRVPVCFDISWYLTNKYFDIVWGCHPPGTPPNGSPKKSNFWMAQLRVPVFYDISRYLTDKYFGVVWGCHSPGTPPTGPQKSISWMAQARVQVFYDIRRYLTDKYRRWSPWGRPWPRGHILKSLSFASKPQVLGLGLNALGPRKLPCPWLEDSTIFWTDETLLKNARNLAENLQIHFFFLQLEHRLSQAGLPPNWNFTNDKNVTKKPIVSSVSVSF